ncbi:MAG: FAD binding domain-containing protein [Bacteroidetes bacterium]|nr:FAD binding domain-containing protein [Bacteroidota bacterium]
MNVNLKFICNNEYVETDINPSVTVLDFLRMHKRLTGTKEGCREGDCGACSVLVGEMAGNFVQYKSVNSCLLPVSEINGKHLVSVEGLNVNGLTPFQEALVKESGTQCGFCTPGFVVSYTAFLLTTESYDSETAKVYLTGNLCRCTGHYRIISSAEKVLALFKERTVTNFTERIDLLISLGLLPEYFRDIPSRLAAIKREHRAAENPQDTVFVSGGTDLFVQQGHELLDKNVVFLSGILKGEKIWIEGTDLFLNASATVSDLENSSIIRKIFPEFKNIASLFGSMQIRNRATLGGNINNASPIGDMSVFLLSLNAKVFLSNGKTTRSVFLKDYFKDYKVLDRNRDEYMQKIGIRLPSGNYKFSYEKVSKRTYLDIASVNTSILLGYNGRAITYAYLSAGGVAPVPLYLKNSSEFLKEKEVTAALMNGLAETAAAEIKPISDVRGSAEYKTLLLKQLIKAHFLRMFPEIFKPEDALC